jgi:hypothetical protein
MRKTDTQAFFTFITFLKFLNILRVSTRKETRRYIGEDWSQLQRQTEKEKQPKGSES